MKKSDVRKYFKTLYAVAEVLGISPSAVSQWPEIIPQGAAYKLQFITGGRLVVDQTLYARRSRKAQPHMEATTP
jgi:DNA-binding transcriptional regulator YdaS (Cro superfamily)